MADIEQTSSNEVMEDASQTSSPRLTAPVPPRVVSESFSQDSQAPVTPTNEIETLDGLFRNSGRSPPTNPHSIKLSSVKSYYSSNYAERMRKRWDSLSDTQKCLFAFLYLRRQFDFLHEKNNQNEDAVFAAVELALTPGNTEYSKLEAFIHKGGDRKGKQDWHCMYKNFKKRHTAFQHDQYSIFKEAETAGGYKLCPLFRFQRDHSVVCFLICAANAISYTMELRHQSTPQEAFQQYSINIGRYMRNKLSDERINSCVFDKHGGGYPVDILEDLLTPVTSGTEKRTEEIGTYLFEFFNPVQVFDTFKTILENYGPIMFSSFKVFPDFANPQKTLFNGDWNNIPKHDGQQRYHAILITGVHKISNGSHGGVLFEAQDSLPNRPFVYLGFDLLKSMGEPRKMHFINLQTAFSGTPPAWEYDVGDTPQDCYLSGVQSPVSGQEEERLTFSEDIDSVRKKLVFNFDTTPDWWGLHGFDRNKAIIT